MLRISGYVKESIVDGPGFRFVIFTQGCDRNCPDCHNPETHDRLGGTEIDSEVLISMIESNPLLDGVTFSGGEPFYQAGELAQVARKCHAMGLNIITYTGYLFEDLERMPEAKALLDESDFLVDGPFIKEQKSYELVFRGSKNQRMIDMARTRKSGKTVLCKEV